VKKKLKIVITPGEPAGIGIDITIKLLQKNIPAQVIVISDYALLEDRAKKINLPITIKEHNHEIFKEHSPGTVEILPVKLKSKVEPGILNTENSSYVIKSIETAVLGCIEGKFDALVTGPVQKSILNESGYNFLGHTEFIGHLAESSTVMMLANDKMKVALVTTHIPLSDVSAHITKKNVEKTVKIVNAELKQKFDITNPVISICGLNPHAGEEGYLGEEELTQILPAIEALRKENLNLIGPISADTAFTKQSLKKCHAVIAMYHDQGLPVLKSAGFGNTVNITLGLPFIRTSVDHGTALNLAGSGKASSGSLEVATKTAIDLYKKI
jgi:4-hydroxythreonine-4-phosphate dehydrogenase